MTRFIAQQAPGAFGDKAPKYNKKTLVLSVVECSEKGSKANLVTGTVVIDISEYASYDCSTDQTFKVETNRAIKGAVGEPNLSITITCVNHFVVRVRYIRGMHEVCVVDDATCDRPALTSMLIAVAPVTDVVGRATVRAKMGHAVMEETALRAP
eukprot:410973-Prorocentrum_minimum.AAC.2